MRDRETDRQRDIDYLWYSYLGTTYTVARSHRHQRTDELTVKKGDKVVVVWVSEDGWWMVRLVNDPSKQGLVPSVCLSKQEENNMETEVVKTTFDG